ncbi:MAG: tRNA pseudouridine38-40 synthase [Verrucomicrobiota bacterium]|jgi:tRNA pseudouridine38-40 synthase
MSRRYKLIVAYDGASFSGWQSQADGNAIQDHLERAIDRISGEDVRVHGAGRTDAGVHALAQCAHVDLAKNLAPERWLRAINSALPPAIRVIRCTRVAQSFHARFSAKGKIYRYRIWNGEVLPPLEHGRAWHITREVDVDLMKAAARALVGEHDFAGFAANRGKPVENTRRTIETIRVRRSGTLIEIEFAADGFLYKMARMLTGALVDCGLGKISMADIHNRLRGAKPRARSAAPACGLFLVRVRY